MEPESQPLGGAAGLQAPGATLADAIADPYLRNRMRDGRRLLIVAASSASGVEGRPAVARRALETAAQAHSRLGVRLDRFLPSKRMMVSAMFADGARPAESEPRSDTGQEGGAPSTRRSPRPRRPRADHVLIDAVSHPLRVSLFRGPRSVHLPALSDHLGAHGDDLAGVLVPHRGELTFSSDQLWLFGHFLSGNPVLRNLWFGDVEGGRWNLRWLTELFD